MFAIFAFADNTRIVLELQFNEEKAQNLKSHAERVESMSQAMQNFKHDNLNMMLGFSRLINARDWDGLGDYYNSYMEKFNQSVNVSDAIAKKLKNIQIPALNGILLARFVQANQQNTEMWIEVDDTVTIPNNDTILLDLCRIAGIFLDNALEACVDVKGAEVRFLATMEEASTVFLFENTCHNPPPLNMIFEKGYSTKGENRGFGLPNVAQIIAGNPRLTLDTNSPSGVFVQKLTIHE